MGIKFIEDSTIELRLGFSFFYLSIKKTLKQEDRKIILIAKRFIQVFEFHGIKKSQIPQIIPEITLKDLLSAEKLISILNNDIINKVVDLFQINREWIEGETKIMYRAQGYDKRPELFFKKFKSIDYKNTFQPIVIFSSKPKLDFSSGKNQLIGLVLREKINDIRGKEIFRYYISSNGWNWINYIERIQLKAMAKIAYELFDIDIPIYKISSNNIKKIREGKIVPSYFILKFKNTGLFLENFSISFNSSKTLTPSGYYPESKENKELQEVEKYAENIIKNIQVN